VTGRFALHLRSIQSSALSALFGERRKKYGAVTTFGKPSGGNLEMIIEMATNEEDLLSMRRIRQQVIEYEMGRALPALSAPEGVAAAHVIARRSDA
jgi:hypothetical protein